jgi:hypothetical protein
MLILTGYCARGVNCLTYATGPGKLKSSTTFVEREVDLAASKYVVGGWPLDGLGLRCIDAMDCISEGANCVKSSKHGVQFCLNIVDGAPFLQMFVASAVEATAGASYSGNQFIRFYGQG